MTAAVVQLLHIEFIGDDEAPAGDYWLARWDCPECGTRGELAGARAGIDGVPLRSRGRELAARHRCDTPLLSVPSSPGHLVP